VNKNWLQFYEILDREYVVSKASKFTGRKGPEITEKEEK
jgi:hypothetical protein